MSFPVFLLLLTTASASLSWNLWGSQSNQLSFSNISSLASSPDAMSAGVIHFPEADCDSIVLSWLDNGRINYRIFYCYFKYGAFLSSSTGFTPFYAMMEQQHSFSYNVPTQNPTISGKRFTPVNTRGSHYSTAVSQDSNSMVFGVNHCFSLHSDPYDAEGCHKTFPPVGGVSVKCDNTSFDVDRDVRGMCRFRMYRVPNENLHEPLVGAPNSVSGNTIRSVNNIYHETDIPEADESSNHANAALVGVNHVVGSVMAMKDLTGNAILDVVYGAVYRRATNKWGYTSGIERACCQNSHGIDSSADGADANAIFENWRSIQVPNGLSSSLNNINGGWMIVNNRILPDGSWNRPARGWLDPDGYGSTSVDIEFEWGIDSENHGRFNHGEAGFFFGVTDDCNYYVYVMSNHDLCGNIRLNDGEGLIKVTNCNRNIVRERGGFPRFHAGQNHHFEITLSEQGQIRIYRDGSLRISENDNNPHQGSYGFYIWDQDGAYFDNIKINAETISGEQPVSKDPTGYSSSPLSCWLNLRVFRFSNLAYSSGTHSGSIQTTFPCSNTNSHRHSCSASWVNLDTNSKPDLLVHCAVGSNDHYKVAYNWDGNGPSSWGSFSRGSINHSNSNTKLTVLDIPFNDKSPATVSPHRIPPVMMITHVNGVLRYRHLLR
ncbi:hypothetical protein P9112_006880 [Eukaryota sp. TZLM1-RC]